MRETKSAYGGIMRDVIREWDSADKLDIALIDADTSLSGNQDFTFLGPGAPDRNVGQG